MMGADGSPSRTRTCDKAINSRLLYQLSYRGSRGGLYTPQWRDARASTHDPWAFHGTALCVTGRGLHRWQSSARYVVF